MDFKENYPDQKVLYQKCIKDPMGHISKNQQNWIVYFSKGKLVKKFLPKQADIDTILKIMQRKVQKGTCLPLPVKEIQAGYLISPYFKDIYLYIAHNKLPSTKTSICKVKILAEKYMLLDSLLFKLVTTCQKETGLSAIPETCADKNISLYHSSLFTGHQGIIKTFWLLEINSSYQDWCIT